MNEIILVDEKDNVLGTMEKLEAHRLGLLHRAFSIFIFNSKNELLLQQRADEKYHSGGLWTNTCCSHPQPGDDLIYSAIKRLKNEMGIEVDSLELKSHFIYRAEFPNALVEHELDYIIFGYSDLDPVLNPEEAKAFQWISLDELKKQIHLHPNNFTFWLKEILERKLI